MQNLSTAPRFTALSLRLYVYRAAAVRGSALTRPFLHIRLKLVIVGQLLARMNGPVGHDKDTVAVDLGVAVGIAGVIHARSGRIRVPVDEHPVVQVEQPNMVGIFGAPLGIPRGNDFTNVLEDARSLTNLLFGKCATPMYPGLPNAVTNFPHRLQSNVDLI